MKSKTKPARRQKIQATGTDLKFVPAGPKEKPVLQTDDPHGADLPDASVEAPPDKSVGGRISAPGGQIWDLSPEAASVATPPGGGGA